MTTAAGGCDSWVRFLRLTSLQDRSNFAPFMAYSKFVLDAELIAGVAEILEKMVELVLYLVKLSRFQTVNPSLVVWHHNFLIADNFSNKKLLDTAIGIDTNANNINTFISCFLNYRLTMCRNYTNVDACIKFLDSNK